MFTNNIFTLIKVVIFTTYTALCCSSCVSSFKYNNLLNNYRELERNQGQKTQSLSRENKVLFEAKLETEQENSLLRSELEDTKTKLDAEVAAYKSFKESSRQKIKELESRLTLTEENSSRKIQEANRQSRLLVDSLLLRIDTLSTQLQTAKGAHSTDVQRLRNELARQKFECEKEIYALTKLKDELFTRIQKNTTPDTSTNLNR